MALILDELNLQRRMVAFVAKKDASEARSAASEDGVRTATTAVPDVEVRRRDGPLLDRNQID